MKPVDFGWILPSGARRMPPGGPPAYAPHLRRVLDRLSGRFHSLWLADHFMDGQHDLPEALTTLSFLTGAYPAFHFGPIVLGQSYRNPALLAKMAATLQQLSGGRFILGLGAGWKEDEHRAFGFEFPPAAVRIDQLAETVQICRAMWDPNQAEATFRGRHYRIEAAVCNPKPMPPPPILIGGSGEKLMLRVVAEHADWWNLIGCSPAIYARKSEILADHCVAIGRDPASIRKTWAGVVSIAPTRAQAEAHLAAVRLWPGDVALVGAPDEISAQLQAFTDLGVDCFMLEFAGEPGLDGLSLFLADVLPNWS